MADQISSKDSSAVNTEASTPSLPRSGSSFDEAFHNELQEHYKLSQVPKGERSEAEQTRFDELQSKLGPKIDALDGTSAE